MPDVRPLNTAAALAGRRIALSVSDSPQLAELGLVPRHLQLALAEIARVVFVSGGRLLYGGDMRAGGHTDLLVHELDRYARSRNALAVYVASPVVRRMPLAELQAFNRRLGLRGELLALDDAGQPLAALQSGREQLGDGNALDSAAKEAAYASMRHALCAQSQARVVIGGQRRGPDVLSGVLEEMLLSLDCGHAVYVAGGFGGTSLDIACEIDDRCAVTRPPTAPARTAGRTDNALLQLGQRAREAGGWRLLNNGLDDTENLRLAATHRPSEIAALIATGLGRLPSGADA